MKFYFKKGFTLVELIVVIGILGLIMIGVSNFQVDVLVYNKYAENSLSSAQDARNVLRVIVKELRTASPSNNGAYAIAQAATSTITFFSDTDGDGLKEQIRYFISTTTPVTLKKGSIKPIGSPSVYSPSAEVFSTLAYNIKNATSTALFEYYDNGYAGTSSPLTQPVTVTSIRLVKINLMIDADPNKSPIPRLYTSQVSLRNLKDNL
ncbi:MAG: type II secretion system protein [Patescibacteria group bacterium]